MSLRFKFDPKQSYQLEAIQAVVDLFEGQPHAAAGIDIPATGGFAAVPNHLDLDEDTILQNLERVQERNLPERLHDAELEKIEGTTETVDGEEAVSFYNFSVEMETGTGKTYIYLRTALELFRTYGMRKFVIVVPSIAICEGVLKTLEVTKDHFAEVYRNLPYSYTRYDSGKLAQVRQFALSDSVEFMVMTLQSFSRDTNILLQQTDHLQGEKPVHLLQGTNPILILDEPQNMESDAAVEALKRLKPLLALRYSATHRNPYNLVYRLTPADAYQEGLVKKIEVASVVQDATLGAPYILVKEVRSQKNTLTARLTVNVLTTSGDSKARTITVRAGDDLQEKTNRLEYEGYVVEEIDYGNGSVSFSNGITVREGQALGINKEPIFREQIRETLQCHFEKQEKVRDQGIKVLSLFFIDTVANYADEDGIIRRIFNECFAEEASSYEQWARKDPEDLQAAYFAQQKRRDGSVELLNSKTGEAARDQEAYELIMRNKEQLLSFEEPVSFIFSHSALREGWDNPNVFQICTLNKTVSEMRKRQEIGRGVRLAVDQSGERIFDPQVNVLTVVANENYEQYVATLQTELEQEGYAAGEQGPRPEERRNKVTAHLREDVAASPRFIELWNRIKTKTRYAVEIDSDRLVEDVVADLASVKIPDTRITATRRGLDITEEGILAGDITAQVSRSQAGPAHAPDLVAMLRHHLEHTTPPCRLTRETLLRIISDTDTLPRALRNPERFVLEAARIIKFRLAEQIVRGIKYHEIDEWYEMSKVFAQEMQGWQWNETRNTGMVGADRALYDSVNCESDVERRFTVGLDAMTGMVKLYTKLPGSFTVDTPVGRYNPDWAVVVEQRGQDRLYLVRETKDPPDLTKLRSSERHKILCGKEHFEALGVDFKVVKDVSELL